VVKSADGTSYEMSGAGTGDRDAMLGRRVSHWVGLAPDDSPLLLRDTGSQDIYALDWESP
jgi:hypothetical protein